MTSVAEGPLPLDLMRISQIRPMTLPPCIRMIRLHHGDKNPRNRTLWSWAITHESTRQTSQEFAATVAPRIHVELRVKAAT